jgi:hypothetical protein
MRERSSPISPLGHLKLGRAVGLGLSVAIVLSSCSSSGRHSGPNNGHSLRASGPQATQVIGVAQPTPGRGYWFSFPRLTNNSSQSIVIKRFQMRDVGSAIKVVSTTVYSVAKTKEYFVTYVDGSSPSGLRLTDPAYAFAGSITIRPGEQSDAVEAVEIAKSQATGTSISAAGCEVEYREGSTTYKQSFECDFRLGSLGGG